MNESEQKDVNFREVYEYVRHSFESAERRFLHIDNLYEQSYKFIIYIVTGIISIIWYSETIILETLFILLIPIYSLSVYLRWDGMTNYRSSLFKVADCNKIVLSKLGELNRDFESNEENYKITSANLINEVNSKMNNSKEIEKKAIDKILLSSSLCKYGSIIFFILLCVEVMFQSVPKILDWIQKCSCV